MYDIRRNVTDWSYDIVNTATGGLVEFHPLDAAGYQRAYARVNALNYRAAAEAERYARRDGQVYDVQAGRWYCTMTAWPYSPAARGGAQLAER